MSLGDCTIINEALCYLLHSYSTSPTNQLKSAFIKFYTFEDAALAKDVLVQSIEKLDAELLPRYPKRKGDNKLKLSTDDLFEIIALVDEKKLMDRLPVFVAHDLKKIPGLKSENIDLFAIATKLCDIEERLQKFETESIFGSSAMSTLYAIDAKLAALARCPPTSNTGDINSQLLSSVSTENNTVLGSAPGVPMNQMQSTDATPPNTDDKHTPPGSSDQSPGGGSKEFHTSTTSRAAHSPTLPTLPSTSDTTASVSWAERAARSTEDAQTQYTTVTNRRNKNNVNTSRNGNSSTNRSAANRSTVAGGDAEGNSSTNRSAARRSAVVGSGAEGNGSGLKAAINLVKKSVLHIDNLAEDCSDTALTTHLTNNNIEVVLCFKCKSWIRGAAENNVNSFRLCVVEKDKVACRDPTLWPKGVVIRDWIFKQDRGHGVPT